jgi:5-methylcytosine-specific restriction endonuclease McrA
MTEEKRAKRNAYLAEWRERNREKIRASQAKYYQANKSKCKDSVKKCRENNPEYYSKEYFAQNTMRSANKDKDLYLLKRKQYYKANSAKDIARVRRRQGKIKHGEYLMNTAELAEVQGLYDYCKIFKGFEVDHIVPINGKNVSGLHVLCNLQVIEISANRRKGNKFN